MESIIIPRNDDDILPGISPMNEGANNGNDGGTCTSYEPSCSCDDYEPCSCDDYEPPTICFCNDLCPHINFS